MIKKDQTIVNLNSGWAYLLKIMLVLLPLDVGYRVWMMQNITELATRGEARSQRLEELCKDVKANVARIEKIERKLLIP